ncbi:MAG: hypothetical protein CSA25_01955 [Desulfobacter postgatei]|uniref:Uncharacterized protein n=1 Tax=Desulfobacter postgatei TaxID=2293 RepID=A0A2G6MU09_9BACT|nr:MAG: hypothetical protein CSA25_01955 [Desulfobacter postgatei]
MTTIKSATDTPDFKSPSRHANELILGMSVRWRNTEGGLKDKQMGDFILTMGLKFAENGEIWQAYGK